MVDYIINGEQMVRILDAFINFDSKSLNEVIKEVQSRKIEKETKIPAFLDQALNEHDGVYRP